MTPSVRMYQETQCISFSTETEVKKSYLALNISATHISLDLMDYCSWSIYLTHLLSIKNCSQFSVDYIKTISFSEFKAAAVFQKLQGAVISPQFTKSVKLLSILQCSLCRTLCTMKCQTKCCRNSINYHLDVVNQTANSFFII